MKTSKILASAFIAGLLALAAGASTASTIATWTPVKTSDWTYLIGSTTYTYSSGHAADAILYTTTNLTQGTDANGDLLANVNSLFPQSTGSRIAYVSSCDSSTSLCTGATDSASASKTSFTFTSTDPFEFLFVHFGQRGGPGELLFHWTQPVNSLTVNGPPGLSNYRALTAVPEPETYAMMVAGLAMLGVALRRRRSAV
ncbi:MAG TPA: PEP-CTERM sorting domain-containing protein [Rhodocyclaceae bacterium]